jgi:hypothetical protein
VLDGCIIYRLLLVLTQRDVLYQNPRSEVFLSLTNGTNMRESLLNCSYVTQRQFSLSSRLVLSNKVTYRILPFFPRFATSSERSISHVPLPTDVLR